MHLVNIGMVLLSLFGKHMQFLVVLSLGLRLLANKDYKSLLLWCLFSGLYLCRMNFPSIDLPLSYRVVAVYDAKTVLSNGQYQIDVYPKINAEIDDYVDFNQENVIQDANVLDTYDHIRRYRGRIKNTDVFSITKNNSLKQRFWNRIKQHNGLDSFLNQRNDSIISLLSLQLSGSLILVQKIMQRFVGKNTIKRINSILTCIYGYLFEASFSVQRIFIAQMIKNRAHQSVFLLLLYPKAVYYPGYYLVYAPYVIKTLSARFSHVSPYLLRLFLLLRLTGSCHLLESLMYPLYRIVGGMGLILVLIGFNGPAYWVFTCLQKISALDMFLIVGYPSIIWFGGLLLGDKRKQWTVFLLMLLSITYPISTRVVMIDVGQGDATLIAFPFNAYTVLIDTGKKSAYQSVKQELHKQGIKKLDYLVITHPDSDHNDNQDEIMSEFSVDNLITKKNESIPLMTQLLHDHHYEDQNENSLILLGQFSKKRFLFTGDASVVQEQELVKQYPNMRVDFLKLGHHGSQTSTSDFLLRSIKPKYALISSNPKVYNHPHPEVMKRLHAYGIIPLETSKHKTIIIKMTPILDFLVTRGKGFGIIDSVIP